MYFSFLLIGAAQLATFCSVSAAISGKGEGNVSNQVFLTKRGIEYTPFNKFFVERASRNKSKDGSNPGETSPKPATETNQDTGVDSHPEIPPEVPTASQLSVSAQAPATSLVVPLSNPVAEISSSQETSVKSGNLENPSTSEELPAPEMFSNAEITITSASKVNEIENQNAEATSTQVNTFILESEQPQVTAQMHSPFSNNLAISRPASISEPSFSSLVASNSAELQPSISKALTTEGPNPDKEVNSGPRVQATMSLIMNGAFYVMQEGQERGFAQTNAPKQAFDSEDTVEVVASPQAVKQNSNVFGTSQKGSEISQEDTSTVTTTSTKYMHGLHRTRTELRKVTTTVCEESAPCAHTDMKMESTRPQIIENIQVEQIKQPVKVQAQSEKSTFMASQTSDITTTLTSTITIKKVRTYDSTIVSETCSTMNEKDHTKTIWNADTTKALGNVTRPSSVLVYEGKARNLAFDVVLGTFCGFVLFFV